MFFADLRRSGAAIVAFIALYLVLSWTITNSYYQLILTMVLIWAIMGMSWNMLSGYSGFVSFGHAAFFGLGAYIVALLAAKGGITPWIGIPVAALAGSVAGLLIGAITFRLKGHYFALAMLVYPLALLYVFEWAGLQEVSLPIRRDDPVAAMQFADPRWNTVLALGLLLAAMLVSLAIERSRLGLSLLSIKQNELAAEASGINSYACKLKAIAISGATAGAVGGLYAVVLLVVTPHAVFGLAASAQALIVTMFGGVGTMWGPVIGAVLLIPLAEILHAELGHKLPGIQGVIFGLAIILVTLRMPQGIAWAFRARFGRRPSTSPQPAAIPAANAPAPSATPLERPASRDDAPVFQVRNVSKGFGGLKALSDVSLKVHRGEILGIIGPNGAGKTTLFNVLNGILAPDRGTIRLNDADLVGLPPNQICARGIGRTFQVMRPFPHMSVLENVVVGAFVKAPDRGRAIAVAQAVLQRVGLSDRADVPAGMLTNVGLRLMELARALASQPTMVLLDEPFAGLSGPEIDQFLDILRKLRSEGLTIVIIEHTMQAMMKIVDRLIVLDHGAVIAQGDPQAVVRDPAVIRAYLGERWVNDAVA